MDWVIVHANISLFYAEKYLSFNSVINFNMLRYATTALYPWKVVTIKHACRCMRPFFLSMDISLQIKY